VIKNQVGSKRGAMKPPSTTANSGGHNLLTRSSLPSPAPGVPPYLQRQNNACASTVATERMGASCVPADVEAAIHGTRGSGQVLDDGVRAQMESAFDADFGEVRIHANAEAHALNQAVSAIAFTTGRDVFFRDGAYSPHSSSGRELLAHELTHVVQQSGAADQEPLAIGKQDTQYEQEAECVASEIAGALDPPQQSRIHGGAAGGDVVPSAISTVQRLTLPETTITTDRESARAYNRGYDDALQFNSSKNRNQFSGSDSLLESYDKGFADGGQDPAWSWPGPSSEPDDGREGEGEESEREFPDEKGEYPEGEPLPNLPPGRRRPPSYPGWESGRDPFDPEQWESDWEPIAD
jgi:hypothetical protein